MQDHGRNHTPRAMQYIAPEQTQGDHIEASDGGRRPTGVTGVKIGKVHKNPEGCR